MTKWISTNGRPSNGALALSQQAGFKRLRTGRGVKSGDTIINWGSGKVLPDAVLAMINRRVRITHVQGHANVVLASNKLDAFRVFAANNIQTVEWTADQAVAAAWKADRKTVVVRNKLTGHSGDGILIIEKDSDAAVPRAPLYTKYLFKVKEFRVHVVNGAAIDVQRKIRDPDREPTDWKVRSHDNGFIYAREGLEQVEAREQLAIRAVAALGLDFGAVDIIESKDGQFYVLEVNTAPGLEGQTLANYAAAF